MGIDAQRSGASELPARAVEVRRAQGATTKAIPVWIVEEEQRSDRPQDPCALAGCGGTWTAVPRRRRGRGQAAGPSGPAAVAATGGSRRSGSLLAALDDAL